MAARLEFGDNFGAVLFIALLTGFAAKLMAEVPSADQTKRSATVVASCFHDVPGHVRPLQFEQLSSVPT